MVPLAGLGGRRFDGVVAAGFVVDLSDHGFDGDMRLFRMSWRRWRAYSVYVSSIARIN
jgi:hypothetical protein